MAFRRFTISKKRSYPKLKLSPLRGSKLRFKKVSFPRSTTYRPFTAPRRIPGTNVSILGKLNRFPTSFKSTSGSRMRSTMFMSKSPRMSRLSKLERKITGYKISKFLLTCAVGQNPVQRMIGAGPDLECITALYTVGYPGTTAQINYPGTISRLRILMFVPNWPGSKLSSFTDPTNTFPIGSVAFTNCFGLEFPNQNQTYPNLPYNSAGVSNVKAYNNLDNTTILSSQLVNHDRIKVFSTRVDYMFRNLNPFHKYDVHIFDVFLRTTEYFDFDGTCRTFTDPRSYLEEIMMNGTNVADNAQSTIRNRYSLQISNNIRKGKLPNKIFKVISHKKITLGRAKPSLNLVVAPTAPIIAIPHGDVDHTQKADKKWSKTYGTKIWYKGPCDTEVNFAQDDLITDYPTKVMHTIVLTLLTDADAIGAGGTDNAALTSSATVAYEIRKTLTWKIKAL